MLLTFYLDTKAATFHTIIEAEEQKNRQMFKYFETLQSRLHFTYHMVYQNEKIRPPLLGVYELCICPCTSPTLSPTTLYTVTKRFAYGHRQ